MESGLLTLVLRGKDAVVSQSGAAGFAIEIEDLISLHITGDSIYTSVMSSLKEGGGFKATRPAPAS